MSAELKAGGWTALTELPLSAQAAAASQAMIFGDRVRLS
jgi:hypothetical protein